MQTFPLFENIIYANRSFRIDKLHMNFATLFISEKNNATYIYNQLHNIPHADDVSKRE